MTITRRHDSFKDKKKNINNNNYYNGQRVLKIKKNHNDLLLILWARNKDNIHKKGGHAQ